MPKKCYLSGNTLAWKRSFCFHIGWNIHQLYIHMPKWARVCSSKREKRNSFIGVLAFLGQPTILFISSVFMLHLVRFHCLFLQAREVSQLAAFVAGCQIFQSFQLLADLPNTSKLKKKSGWNPHIVNMYNRRYQIYLFKNLFVLSVNKNYILSSTSP